MTDLYSPKTFFNHAALLRQPFGHCAKFLTAASRRSLGRISIPVWLIILSDQLPIVALVGHYPTNKLIGRRPILKCEPKPALTTYPEGFVALFGISSGFPGLSQSLRQVTYVLLTRSPVYLFPEGNFLLDLHVSSTPPAFVLSQDQTLHCMFDSVLSLSLSWSDSQIQFFIGPRILNFQITNFAVMDSPE